MNMRAGNAALLTVGIGEPIPLLGDPADVCVQ
jgi:hypothetical protein